MATWILVHKALKLVSKDTNEKAAIDYKNEGDRKFWPLSPTQFSFLFSFLFLAICLSFIRPFLLKTKLTGVDLAKSLHPNSMNSVRSTLMLSSWKWSVMRHQMHPNWWSVRVYVRYRHFIISWREKRSTSWTERTQKRSRLRLQNTSNKDENENGFKVWLAFGCQTGFN